MTRTCAHFTTGRIQRARRDNSRRLGTRTGRTSRQLPEVSRHARHSRRCSTLYPRAMDKANSERRKKNRLFYQETATGKQLGRRRRSARTVAKSFHQAQHEGENIVMQPVDKPATGSASVKRYSEQRNKARQLAPCYALPLPCAGLFSMLYFHKDRYTQIVYVK